MSCYFVASIKIKDNDIYAKYLEKSDEVFEKCHGKYLVVDKNPEILEGKWDYTKMVIIEFKNKQELKEWYNSEDYQDILRYRIEGAICDTVIVEGKMNDIGNKLY